MRAFARKKAWRGKIGSPGRTWQFGRLGAENCPAAHLAYLGLISHARAILYRNDEKTRAAGNFCKREQPKRRQSQQPEAN